MGPPEAFQPKVREQSEIGFWNISSRLTSAASVHRNRLTRFPTSGTLSQTMTLKRALQQTFVHLDRKKSRYFIIFVKRYENWQSFHKKIDSFTACLTTQWSILARTSLKNTCLCSSASSHNGSLLKTLFLLGLFAGCFFDRFAIFVFGQL